MIITKQIKTKNAEILIIGGLPEDAKNITVNMPFKGHVEFKHKGIRVREVISTTGNWQPIGFLKDITEDEAKELVEHKNIVSDCSCEICGYDVDCYRNYLEQSDEDWNKYPTTDRLSTAKESLLSLIEANVKINNSKEYPTKENTGLQYGIEYVNKVEEWEAEEAQVWKNIYLLKKIVMNTTQFDVELNKIKDEKANKDI